ncbi:MAG TPA: hypothetical protein VF045_03785 [Acidimicrobiales bacterium]
MRIEVRHGDVLDTPADVLLLKYAERHYGADLAAHRRLASKGIDSPPPPPGGYSFVRTGGALAAAEILTIAVGPLGSFEYEEIRQFGSDALRILASERPSVRVLAGPIHGPGTGLDEVEAVKSLVAGFVDEITGGDAPAGLERIVIVERNLSRVRWLQPVIETLVPNGVVANDRGTFERSLDATGVSRLAGAGVGARDKQRVFVAMEFDDDSEDLFRFGIYEALDEDAFLCERGDSDLAATGDILESVLGKIRNADYFIADVTKDNPNVFLELGFAWGADRNVLIVARESRREALPFNIRNQRTIFYRNHGHLQEQLRDTIRRLGQGAPTG